MGPNEQMFFRHRKILKSYVNPKFKLQINHQRGTINLNNVTLPSVENSPMIHNKETETNGGKTKPQTMSTQSLRFQKHAQRILNGSTVSKMQKK